MPDKIADKVIANKISLQRGIKSKMFDIIAVAIVLALILVSLGILERRIITWHELGNIAIECIPFFFAAMLLSNNFYLKGVFLGKTTDVFKNTCESYSKIISDLTGEQIDSVDEFCEEFNNEALKKVQNAYLKRASMSYERFITGKENVDGDGVMTYSKEQLIHTFGKERAKYIQLAKDAEVKGLRVNTLLGTNDSNDITDIGPTETQLSTKHSIMSACAYLASTLIMSFIGVKNVMEWGWFGAALVLFKCAFILCKAYMSYFDGYQDVTIHLVNHTNRKIDILKQFLYWWNKKLQQNTDDGNKNNISE